MTAIYSLNRLAFGIVAAFGVLASLPAAAAVTPAVTYQSTGTLADSRPFTLGFAFELSQSTDVTHLGVWAGGTSGDYLAGLWVADGTLLASTTVLATDTLVDAWRWGEIPTLTLAPGRYVVAAEYLGGLFPSQAQGISTIAGYSWVNDLQLIGAGLNFPTVTTSGNYGANGILWANFATGDANGVIPEPATWGMMIAGFGLVGFAARRRSRAVIA